MPNWCGMSLTIFNSKGENDKNIDILYENIKRNCLNDQSESAKLIGIDSQWLENLAYACGVSLDKLFIPKNNDSKYINDFHPKAFLYDVCRNDDGSIRLYIDSAWNPCDNFLEALFNENLDLLKDLDYVYIADECGNDVYINTDTKKLYYSTEYCITTDEEIFGGEDQYFDSKEELLEFFNTRINKSFKSTKELEEWLSDYEGYCNLHYYFDEE